MKRAITAKVRSGKYRSNDLAWLHITYLSTLSIASRGEADPEIDLVTLPSTLACKGYGLHLLFLHGRKRKGANLKEWGYDGGCLKQVETVTITTDVVSVIISGGKRLSFPIVGDLVQVESCHARRLALAPGFYGDLEVQAPGYQNSHKTVAASESNSGVLH